MARGEEGKNAKKKGGYEGPRGKKRGEKGGKDPSGSQRRADMKRWKTLGFLDLRKGEDKRCGPNGSEEEEKEASFPGVLQKEEK